MDIKKIVLASTTDATAEKAWISRNNGSQINCSAASIRFHGEKNAFPPELVKALRVSGHVLFHTDDFYGLNNATSMANLLRASLKEQRYALK